MKRQPLDQLAELTARLVGPPGLPGRGRPGRPGPPGLQGATGLIYADNKWPVSRNANAVRHDSGV